MARTLVCIFVFNEGERFRTTLGRFPKTRDYDVLVVDDGSTDGAADGIEREGFIVLRNERNQGLGASIKRAFHHALDHGYETIVIMAGNGKDDPAEIPRLLGPLSEGYDFVQGSRFLPGGQQINIPFYRVIATRFVHPLLFTLVTRQWVTETTNGFRAFRTEILRDSRIDWEQSWLDLYELEQYVQFKVCRLGYRRKEVPVTKSYPPRNQPYTKVKAITGWWSMIKPVLYLGLGIRR